MACVFLITVNIHFGSAVMAPRICKVNESVLLVVMVTVWDQVTMCGCGGGI